jgi:L1 cell adhesion molecule like protein
VASVLVVSFNRILSCIGLSYVFLVFCIINEHSAAAMTYGLDKKFIGERDILATVGDTYLGGEDFDNCLTNFLQEFEFKKDLLLNSRALCRLYTHAHFEELCQDLFHSALEPVEKVLRAKIDKANVHEVVRVGESTYIPQIVKPVSDQHQSGQGPCVWVAVQVTILSADTSEEHLLFNVTPLSLRYVFLP